MGRRLERVTSGNGHGGRGSCPQQEHSQDFRQGRGRGLCVPDLGIAVQVGIGWVCTRQPHRVDLRGRVGGDESKRKESPSGF